MRLYIFIKFNLLLLVLSFSSVIFSISEQSLLFLYKKTLDQSTMIIKGEIVSIDHINYFSSSYSRILIKPVFLLSDNIQQRPNKNLVYIYKKDDIHIHFDIKSLERLKTGSKYIFALTNQNQKYFLLESSLAFVELVESGKHINYEIVYNEKKYKFIKYKFDPILKMKMSRFQYSNNRPRHKRNSRMPASIHQKNKELVDQKFPFSFLYLFFIFLMFIYIKFVRD